MLFYMKSLDYYFYLLTTTVNNYIVERKRNFDDLSKLVD